jgi:hypothetical protein
MACGPGLAGYQQATKLISVSRRWSAIGTELPELWAYIEVNLSDRVERIRQFWDTMVGRTKGTPATICIRNVGINAAALRACRLDAFARIKAISLLIQDEDAIFQLISEQFRPPVIPFERLNLLVDTSIFHMPWNAGILTRFPRFNSLELKGFLYPTRNVQTFPDVSFLRIRDHFSTVSPISRLWTSIRSLSLIHLPGWFSQGFEG